jgi:hypothetical protein
MSYKSYRGIPKALLRYNPNSSYNQPSIVPQNPYLDNLKVGNMTRNQKFNFQMPRGLEVPDLTAYSQGNVGGKNN